MFKIKSQNNNTNNVNNNNFNILTRTKSSGDYNAVRKSGLQANNYNLKNEQNLNRPPIYGLNSLDALDNANNSCFVINHTTQDSQSSSNNSNSIQFEDNNNNNNLNLTGTIRKHKSKNKNLSAKAVNIPNSPILPPKKVFATIHTKRDNFTSNFETQQRQIDESLELKEKWLSNSNSNNNANHATSSKIKFLTLETDLEHKANNCHHNQNQNNTQATPLTDNSNTNTSFSIISPIIAENEHEHENENESGQNFENDTLNTERELNALSLRIAKNKNSKFDQNPIVSQISNHHDDNQMLQEPRSSQQKNFQISSGSCSGKNNTNQANNIDISPGGNQSIDSGNSSGKQTLDSSDSENILLNHNKNHNHNHNNHHVQLSQQMQNSSDNTKIVKNQSHLLDIDTSNPSMELIKLLKDHWYRPNLSRDEAINILKTAPFGSFIIRDSTSYKGGFGLALRIDKLTDKILKNVQSQQENLRNKADMNTSTSDHLKSIDLLSEHVRHYLIETINLDGGMTGYLLKGSTDEKIFPSLDRLIYKHMFDKISLPIKLNLQMYHRILNRPAEFAKQTYVRPNDNSGKRYDLDSSFFISSDDQKYRQNFNQSFSGVIPDESRQIQNNNNHNNQIRESRKSFHGQVVADSGSRVGKEINRETRMNGNTSFVSQHENVLPSDVKRGICFFFLFFEKNEGIFPKKFFRKQNLFLDAMPPTTAPPPQSNQ